MSLRANATICLINQVNFLLDQQIAALEKQFMTEGGYSEQLAAARLAQRSRNKKEDPTNPTDPTDQIPDCPVCGKLMVPRTAKQGQSAGQSFWGCPNYPDCKGVVKV